MKLLDWMIFVCLMACLLLVAWRFRRYLRSVADFIVVDRKMRKYLGLSSGMAEGLGLVTVAYIAEQGFQKGLGYIWLSLLNVAVCVPIFGILGIGIRRFRATGVQTIPQFHEMRFSRGVRICVGVALAVGGILNMAVFPIVSSQFLVHFLDLPLTIAVGTAQVPTTYLCMLALVSVAVTTALLGGMITVIVTDYIQSILISASMLLIAALILTRVGFVKIDAALTAHIGKSAYNPFEVGGSYGPVWVIFWVLSAFLGSLSFPPSTSKVSATDNTDTPRKMALLSSLFGSGRSIVVLLWGVGALAAVGMTLPTDGVPDGEYARYASAVFVRELTPTGLLGLCAAGLVFAYVTVDSSYYLAWSAIVVNDVIIPVRGKPLSQTQHLRLLRLVMVGIAGFLLFWGIIYRPQESILSYLYLTAAIFTAAGIVSYFGLYWKRANALGAYCTVAICLLVPLADLIGKQFLGKRYPLEQHQSGLIALVAPMLAFVVCGYLNNSGLSKWVDYGQVVRDEDRARRAQLAQEYSP